MKCICKQCGNEFELEQAEIEFYESRNLDLPKRCKECRDANKQKKRQRAAEYRRRRAEGEDGSASGRTQRGSGRNYSARTRQTGQRDAERVDQTASAGYQRKSSETGKANQTASAGTIEEPKTVRPAAEGRKADAAGSGSGQMREQKPGKSSGNLGTTIISILALLIVLCAMFVWSSSRKEKPSEPAARSESAIQSELSASGLAFRNEELLQEHYQKHGVEMGFASAKEYEAAAASVVENNAALHKLEAEDGDDVYYLEDTNEFVIVSTDGYLRTYFYPNDGIEYYNRQ